eukprot:6213430-Pleurochrysis_carterae.AAC.8
MPCLALIARYGAGERANGSVPRRMRAHGSRNAAKSDDDVSKESGDYVSKESGDYVSKESGDCAATLRLEATWHA